MQINQQDPLVIQFNQQDHFHSILYQSDYFQFLGETSLKLVSHPTQPARPIPNQSFIPKTSKTNSKPVLKRPGYPKTNHQEQFKFNQPSRPIQIHSSISTKQ
jgi:hypothetical protein